MKVLNLYSGIGGNRKLWENVEVTAVEKNEAIANIYKDFFPNDNVIVGDAHQYLLDHYKEYDFIWSSPPCPTHSKVRKYCSIKTRGDGTKWEQNKPIYPDMTLYQEIIFLQGYATCKWVVENVIGWYEPLIYPLEIGKHYYWSNFHITNATIKTRMHDGTVKDLQNLKGFDLSKYNNIDKILALRNCVEPEMGLHIFNAAQSKTEVFQNDLFKVA